MPPTILLCDNGSRRPEASLSLRALARDLSRTAGQPIHPVSLQHADRVPAEALGGEPAHVLESFLADRLAVGERRFLILPLFFGPSRAVTRFIPQTAERLRQTWGDFGLRVAQTLCPLPAGEPRLTDLMLNQILAARSGQRPDHAVLVDHGSPIPEVTAVRRWLANHLKRLRPDITWHEAVMERRLGAEYDFNGRLLAQVLEDIAAARPNARISLGLLSLHPGRHAGPGGDIEQIREAVSKKHAALDIAAGPLAGAHPALIEILNTRLCAAAGIP